MDYNEQIKIQELKYLKYIEQGGNCAFCGEPFLSYEYGELAHILPQRNWILKKYGKEIIHHKLNLKLTHPGRCNSGVQMSPNKTRLVAAHVAMIKAAIDAETSP